MRLEVKMIRTLICAICCLLIASCSYNPFISNNHTTGSPTATAVGAGIGAGSVWLFSGSKTMMVVGGIAGGALGYYLTSLRYDAAGIIDVGGDVYVLGDYIGIYIPTDRLFEANTAELLPRANVVLDSTAAVLKRKPNNNIMISGNTSGFDRARREVRLSQARAKVVAAYLWTAGIQQTSDSEHQARKLNYVGYGDFFPIASDHTNKGIRANSRIQITSYPSSASLHDRSSCKNCAPVNDFAGDDTTRPINDACGRAGDC